MYTIDWDSGRLLSSFKILITFFTLIFFYIDIKVICDTFFSIMVSAMGGILPLYKVLCIYFSYVYKVSPQSKW